MKDDDRKNRMKALREARKTCVERARNTIKSQSADIRKIRECIQGEGKTVPEIATLVQMPGSKVMWYIATLKKYGEVAEGEKDGDYFRYKTAS